jgi:anaerobic dimethyl sulfoxide reductase subunit B (iron-sulfur subunit)
MKRLAFYYDSSMCSGCKTCQIACKDKNDLPLGVNWRRVYEVTGGDWIQKNKAWISDVYAYNVSLSCNHCEDPICQKNCPTNAISKREDGIVLIDTEKCMGCKYCAWVCPYGAPQFDDSKGVMTKCDLCADYVDEGKNPSCVDSCPMRTFDFGDYEELKEKYGEETHIYPLPKPDVTEPSILIKPHKDAERAGNENPEVSNMEEIKHA